MQPDDAGVAPSGGAGVRLWVGTYPAGGPDGVAGAGEGIWRLVLDPGDGSLSAALAATSAAPSFLASSPDGRTLYAAGEVEAGTVSAFSVAPDGALTEQARVSSGGRLPCHLLVHPDGRALYVCNYGSGTVGVLTLRDGGFSPEVLAARGPVQVLGPPDRTWPGPDPERQEGPHAHSTVLAPGGRHLLLADLGADTLRRLAVHHDGTLTDEGVACELPPGTGPRHLAVGPGRHLYVVGELTATVHVLAWDPTTATAEHLSAVAACRTAPVSGDRAYPAHLALVDGQLLVSVRGPDVLGRLSLREGGARLEHVCDVPVGGARPRHFAVVPPSGEPAGGTGWVVTAAQDAGQVTVLRWDAAGLGDALADRVTVPYPACVLLGR